MSTLHFGCCEQLAAPYMSGAIEVDVSKEEEEAKCSVTCTAGKPGQASRQHGSVGSLADVSLMPHARPQPTVQ